MRFSRGGWQEARGGGIGGNGGRGHPQDYFVENVFEELDAAREFYYNASSSTLFWVPPAGADVSQMQPGDLVAPALETLLKVSAEHVRFEGLHFAHTLPTYMQPYEPTSGGDWAVHRGAATMIENATGISLDGCVWDQVEGNGVMLSHFVRDSKLTNSEVAGAGDTPIVLLGSADLMDGRGGTQPWNNEVSSNYFHSWGAWGRQAAGYFEGLAGNTNVSFNVFHDGPRAGANFNGEQTSTCLPQNHLTVCMTEHCCRVQTGSEAGWCSRATCSSTSSRTRASTARQTAGTGSR